MTFKTMKKLIGIFERALGDDRGMALVEGAFFLPVLMTMMFSMYDIGNGIIIKQKLLASAHTAADLLARKMEVRQGDVDQAVEGARLALQPYPDNIGIDIVSIKFGSSNAPATLWRRTYNMPADTSLPQDADGLGVEGEGVIAVTVRYTYRPMFAGILLSDMDMQETAYLRGRRSSVVEFGS